MEIDDFRYMFRGKPVANLADSDHAILKPIIREGAGRERALLLLHGFSSTPAVYRLMLPELRYDTIICPTLPGHGESIEAFSQVSAEDWVHCAEKHCETLIRDYQHVDVMGLSLGGVLANHLATRYPLNHLYLLAPAFDLRLNINLMLKLAKLLHYLGFRRIRNQAGNLRSDKYPELTYRQVPIATIIQILHFIQSFHWEPPICPVDLFLGRFDDVVNSPRVAARYESLPKVRIHWLENSAHILPLDNNVATILHCLQESFT